MEIETGSFTFVEDDEGKAIYADITIYTAPESGGQNISLYLRLPHRTDMTIDELQQLAKEEALNKLREAAEWLSESI